MNKDDKCLCRKRRTRNSNIELLRILCMIGIVAYHYMQHGGVNGSALLKTPFSLNHVFITVFGTWGVLGVLTFVIISSYFLSGGGGEFTRLKSYCI